MWSIILVQTSRINRRTNKFCISCCKVSPILRFSCHLTKAVVIPYPAGLHNKGVNKLDRGYYLQESTNEQKTPYPLLFSLSCYTNKMTVQDLCADYVTLEIYVRTLVSCDHTFYALTR